MSDSAANTVIVGILVVMVCVWAGMAIWMARTLRRCSRCAKSRCDCHMMW